MPITDTFVKTVKYSRTDEKPQREYDTDGLYMEITPKGVKKWLMKYKRPVTGKENRLSFGSYPDVSLKDARKKRDNARKLIAQGMDPSDHHKEKQRQAKIAIDNDFEMVAREWWAFSRNKWTERHAQQTIASLENDIFPFMGKKAINAIKPLDVLDVLRKIESRGAYEIAKRVKQRCEAIFRYAIVTEKATYNPVTDLQGALTAANPTNYAAITPKELPDFLAAIVAYPCEFQTRIAFNLLMLTGVRTGEVIGARWCEFDIAAKEWRIPAERMKRRQEHIVPLSRQVLALLDEIRPLTSHFELMFPHRSEPLRPMSNMTMLRMIERVGYKGLMTGHGFRSLFSSILNESNLFNPDAIERQLAHVPASKVRGAYLRTQFMPERHKMMQWYADHLDLIQSKNVISVKFGGAA